MWSKLLPDEKSWQGALDACAALTHNGKEAGSWRLPANRELLAAYGNGIKDAASGDWISESGLNDFFWSASSYSHDTNDAWIVDLGYGYTYYSLKTNFNLAVVCVQ